MTAPIHTHRAPSVAALFHGLDWNLPHDGVEIDTGVSIDRLHGTPVERLYRDLHADHGVHGEDPGWCEFFVLFDAAHGDLGGSDYMVPFSPIDRLCNVITLVCGQPPDLCRVIRSSDQFNTLLDTAVLFGPGDSWGRHFTEEDADMVGAGWHLLGRHCKEQGMSGRLARALTSFSQGWRACDQDQAFSNLIATLDILLARKPSRTTLAATGHSLTERVAHSAPNHFIAESLVRAFYKEESASTKWGIRDTAFKLSASLLREMLFTGELDMALESVRLPEVNDDADA